MDAQVKSEFKNDSIGTGKILNIIKKCLNDSCQEKSKFVISVLKECCFYLKSIPTKLSKNQLSEISSILDECFKCNFELEDDNLQLQKCLFCIMSELIRLNGDIVCLKVADFAVDLYSRRKEKKSTSADSLKILKNCYLLLWNHGVKLSQQRSFEYCGLYFLNALKCLSYFTTTLNDLIHRAIKTMSALADYSDKLNCYHSLNELIVNTVNAWPTIGEKDIPETLNIFHNWNCNYAFAKQNNNDRHFTRSILLQSNLLLNKFETRSLQVTPIIACKKCLEFLDYGLEIFSKTGNPETSKLFTKTYLHLERIFSKTFTLANEMVHRFALEVARDLLDSVQDIASVIQSNMDEDLLLNVKSTYFFNLHLLSIKNEEKNSQTTSFNAIVLLSNLFHLFMTLAQDEKLLSLVLRHATAAIPKVAQIINWDLKNVEEKIANIGLILANLGSIAYSKSLYTESIPFLNESCNILLKWCKQNCAANEISQRILKVNLENKYSMLVACLRKTQAYSKCLKILLDIIPVCYDSSSLFVNYWILVQNEMKSVNNHHNQKTIIQALQDSKISLPNNETFCLLHLELKALKQQRFNTHEYKYEVVLLMKKAAGNKLKEPLNVAIAMLELAQIQYYKPIDGEQSAKFYCDGAINILKAALQKSPLVVNASDMKIVLASAFYWQYLIELQVNQEIAKFEMAKKPVIPLEQKLFAEQGYEEEDPNPIENTIPNFVNTTVDKELETFIPLNRALSLWSEIITNDSTTLSSAEQILVDLQTTAEIYSLSRQETRERRAWVLGRQLSSRYNLHSTYVVCTSRLVHVLCSIGDVKEVLDILKSCENVLPKLRTDKADDIFATLRYQLALTEFSFCVKDVNGGLKILSEIWDHSYFEKKGRRSTLLCAEMRIIASQFARLPADLHESTVSQLSLPWGKSNAIELLLQAIQYFMKLVKDSPDRDIFPALCHYVVASLMNAHMIIVQLFIEIGATREARWFLKEQLNYSHRLALGIRMSEFMSGLARLDLVCDNVKACLSKLHSIQYLLGNEDLKNLLDISNAKFTKTDRLLLYKLQLHLPQYLGHSVDCNCSKCQIPILRLLALQTLNLYVEYLSITGYGSDALQLSQLINKLSRHKLTKYSTILSVCEARLTTSRLLYAQNNYTEAQKLAEDSIKQLEALPYACSKLSVLLPEFLYQKCICSLNYLAKNQNVEILNLTDSIWSIDKSINMKRKSKDPRNLGSANREPLSPIKLKIPNHDCLSASHDRAVMPQNLLNAPKRKTRRFLNRWAKFEEPSSDIEDENTPQKKLISSNNLLPSFNPDSICLEEHEDESIDSVIPLQDGNAQCATRTQQRRVHCKLNKGNKIIGCQNPTNLQPQEESVVSERVTRSRQKAIASKERLRTIDETDNLNLNISLDSSLLEKSSDESLETFDVVDKLEPVEILRGGKRGDKKREERTEEVELPRNIGGDSSDKLNLDVTHKSVVETCIKELSLDQIIECLEKAFRLVSHHPIYPLYPNLCFLLALVKGPTDPLCSYYFSESAFITLRHQCIINLGKKLCKKQNSEESSIKLVNYYNSLDYSSLSDEERKKRLEDHINSLPDEWAVCQISFIPDSIQKMKKCINQPLIVTRFQKGKKPIIVRVPTAIYKQEEVPIALLDEFEQISEANRETMKSDDRVIWWKSRRGLDQRMKNFIDDLENVWIGHWKGLFLGCPISKDAQQLLENVTQEIMKAAGNKCNVDQYQFGLFLDSIPWLTTEQIELGLVDLFGLKEQTAHAKKLVELIKAKTEPLKSNEINRQPIVVIPGKEIECLPWECMPIIRDKPVSRMPSFALLSGHLSWQKNHSNSVFTQGVDSDKTYFILNPSDDLPHTQEKFEEWFVKELKWLGIVGRPPTENEFSDGLTMHDLFIYCGHGSGGKYLSGDIVQRLYCSAVTLLMGCSSGKLRSLGRGLEPSGSVLQYLLAGCPSVVADLWDVTDRDIDRFLESLLSLWLQSKGENLCRIITQARLACRLPYLIGAAPVTYGLPVNIKL